MSGTDIKPAFQVEKVHGTFKRIVYHIQEEVRTVGALKDKQIITRKIVPIEEEFQDGYMIYCPMKHSIFVAADDEAQLRHLGVMESPYLVDMNSGDTVPRDYVKTPKELVSEHSTRHRGSTGGLSELDKGVIA